MVAGRPIVRWIELSNSIEQPPRDQVLGAGGRHSRAGASASDREAIKIDAGSVYRASYDFLTGRAHMRTWTTHSSSGAAGAFEMEWMERNGVNKWISVYSSSIGMESGRSGGEMKDSLEVGRVRELDPIEIEGLGQAGVRLVDAGVGPREGRLLVMRRA